MTLSSVACNLKSDSANHAHTDKAYEAVAMDFVGSKKDKQLTSTLMRATWSIVAKPFTVWKPAV